MVTLMSVECELLWSTKAEMDRWTPGHHRSHEKSLGIPASQRAISRRKADWKRKERKTEIEGGNNNSLDTSLLFGLAEREKGCRLEGRIKGKIVDQISYLFSWHRKIKDKGGEGEGSDTFSF